MKAPDDLFAKSDILQRVMEAQEKILASDSIMQKVMEAQEKLFSKSNILQRVMEAQEKILASDSIMQRAMEAQEKLFSKSGILQRVMEAQEKILASDGILQRAIEAQEKLFSKSGILQRVMETQEKLYDTSLFLNSDDFQKKLFSTKLFDDNFINKIELTYNSINHNFQQFNNIDIGEILEKHNILPNPENEYKVINDSIIAGDSKYSIDEVRNMILGVLDESGLTHLHTSVNDSFNKLFLLLHKMKDSNQRNFIFNIISAIIISIFSIILTPKLIEISDKVFYQNKKVVIKQIDNLRSHYPDIPNEIIKNLRFVTAKVLNVRFKSNQKSNIVGKLYFGQIVTLIAKKKSWSLVEWVDKENSITIKGWVFTRYIKKFK